ncbi:50S ribosomal protein L11 methyltransferase [Apibacter sp.]|uniref:50S ribosomal protein L11 methyltransferase n=1 Tax=Apibacter sp. TaxID=2023709 RepID=UPI0025D8A0F5|nr:50S ribosomal protein L11 methyltransferase [Apibacter sp.]MCT6869426.1 50S ribosomal protein L11 methyltransferase [Apibacter sp.]
MKYTEYHFHISPLEPWRDILLAYLSELPFESFVETETGFLTYIKVEEEEEQLIKELPIMSSSDVSITYEKKLSPDINWNEEWEKNFPPVIIENQIYLYADFHPIRNEFPFPIKIEPKMSFGTGHHETTYNMLHTMLSMNFEGKEVLDMGSGTGVLAIFAKMRGAHYVEAIDIDEWSYGNALENSKKNGVDIDIKLGDANLLGNHAFDIILANINKNILLKDMSKYAENLLPNGQLLVSGIFEHDFDDIIAESSKYGLKFDQKLNRNNWISILLYKDDIQ